MENVTTVSRTAATIVAESKSIRKGALVSDYNEAEVAEDLALLSAEIISQLEKANKGVKAAKKRVRDLTKAVETFGKLYRAESVKK